MPTSTRTAAPPPLAPEPAWDIARLFPGHGQWDEGDYLTLNRNTNHLVELSDGHVEVLEMPTRPHQRTVLHLYEELSGFAEAKDAGDAIVAPYPVRLVGGEVPGTGRGLCARRERRTVG
jgi:hypothetical protein